VDLPALRRRRRGARHARSAACRPRGFLNTEGLDIPDEQLEAILAVDVEQWKAEVPPIREFFDEFGDRLPPEVSTSWTRWRSA
jgi:GTP-dependent phosphoenolpyruvate carboxykinase